MAKRIVRKPIEPLVSSELHHIQPDSGFILMMNKGDDIDVSYLQSLSNSNVVVKELNIFLRGQAAKRAVANNILVYLRYVISVKGEAGSNTLKEYKNHLDRDESITLNTKSQKLSGAMAFVRHLMACEVVKSERLPANFSKSDVSHKKTFIDFCRYDLSAVTSSIIDEVDYWERTLKVDRAEAESLAFGISCMNAIRNFANERLERYRKDCHYIDKIVGKISNSDIEKYKSLTVEDIRKCPEEIIKWLYVRHGHAIPATNEVRASMEWWRKQPDGWSLTRLRAAFFPTVQALEAYFMVGLTDQRLCPNVDGLRSYTYLDCCKPAQEKSYVDVFVGKNRGGSSVVALPETDLTVKAFSELSRRVTRLLPNMPGGKEYLRQESPSLFVACQPAAGRKEMVRVMDASTPANLVRRFIRDASVQYSVLVPLVGVATGENFRPTHAYLKKLSGKSIYKIQNDLNHKSSSTTRGYVEGVETQAIQLRRQKEFQRFLLDQASGREVKRTGSGYCIFWPTLITHSGFS